MIDNFIYYGSTEVSEINRIIENSDLDWEKYTYRQKERPGVEESKTIPLIWSEDFENNKFWEAYYIFEFELKKIEKKLISLVGDGKIEIAILINLPKNKKILPHTDAGHKHFFKTKRLHIPILTNDKCNFTVGDETIQMKCGEIWEINNAYKPHSVNNDGDTDRIHLLIDYKLFDEKKIFI